MANALQRCHQVFSRCIPWRTKFDVILLNIEHIKSADAKSNFA